MKFDEFYGKDKLKNIYYETRVDPGFPKGGGSYLLLDQTFPQTGSSLTELRWRRPKPVYEDPSLRNLYMKTNFF